MMTSILIKNEVSEGELELRGLPDENAATAVPVVERSETVSAEHRSPFALQMDDSPPPVSLLGVPNRNLSKISMAKSSDQPRSSSRNCSGLPDDALDLSRRDGRPEKGRSSSIYSKIDRQALSCEIAELTAKASLANVGEKEYDSENDQPCDDDGFDPASGMHLSASRG